jgi:Asp-tRNA(Asn)/Glu-tRNA(Gln) amidotransferase A subunit family amidase
MIINILKAYEAGEILVESLISNYLQRIISQDDAFNAVIHINNNAVNEAKTLDAFFRKNKKLKGRLHGIPVIIKANIKTNGDLPTSCGSILLENYYANENALIVDWLHHEGAIIIGKSNMTEFSNYVSNSAKCGFSSLGGQTNSIFGQDFQVGGSSSGSAVSVAASFCCFAIGTETDGSVVYPAAYNGVFAHKFVPGEISLKGVIGISSFFDSIGIFTANLDDLSFLVNLITPSNNVCIPIKKVFVEKQSFDMLGNSAAYTNLFEKVNAFFRNQEILLENGNFIEDMEPYFKQMDVICQTEFKEVVTSDLSYSKSLFLELCQNKLLGTYYHDMNEINRSLHSCFDQTNEYQTSISSIIELQFIKKKFLIENNFAFLFSFTLGSIDISSIANLAGLSHLVIPIRQETDFPISLSFMGLKEKTHEIFNFADLLMKYLHEK